MSTIISEANWSINVLSGLGFLIAVYSYYVKWSYKRNPSGYRALCDLGENISCSRVITSKYGSGFGVVGRLFGEKSNLNVSNSILGALFYIVQIALSKYWIGFCCREGLSNRWIFSGDILNRQEPLYIDYPKMNNIHRWSERIVDISGKRKNILNQEGIFLTKRSLYISIIRKWIRFIDYPKINQIHRLSENKSDSSIIRK